MGVDYSKQYRPDQLEPFWPNELVKMSVVVLCTMAIIMFFAVLPVVLGELGLAGMTHEQEPANPRGATPVGIKPEWYFLAVYEYLRIMPTEFLGVSGKTWGVLTQGVVVVIVVALPFTYRRRAHTRPGNLYRLMVTAVIAIMILLTIRGGWPEGHTDEGGEQMLSMSAYLHEKAPFFGILLLSVVVFYALIARERRAIRRVLYDRDRPDGSPAEPEEPS